MTQFDDEREPNYEAAYLTYRNVIAYWPPEWVDDRTMFAKMLDDVLAAAAEPEEIPRDV